MNLIITQMKLNYAIMKKHIRMALHDVHAIKHVL